MTPPGRNTDGPADAECRTAGPAESLADLLTRQLAEARRGRLERVADLARRIEARLAETPDAGLALAEADRRRLRDLDRRVRLALAQQRDDVARRRAGIRRGKQGTRAYGNSAARPPR